MELRDNYRGDYILGTFVAARIPTGEVKSFNPSDLDAPARLFPFQYDHVGEVVLGAQRGFRSWQRLAVSDRLSALTQYVKLLEIELMPLAALISMEMGKPLWEAEQEVRDTVSLINYHLGQASQSTADKEVALDEKTKATLHLAPRGVMCVFTPADMPCYGTHRHFIPVLIAGNSTIVASNPQAPSVTQALATIAHESGLPAGVFNTIHGDEELFRRLAIHPDVDGIFFSGSVEQATKIKKQTAMDLDRLLVLETGSKNDSLIWSDCDFDSALKHSFVSAFLTAGQRSTSTKRILVHDSIFEKFLKSFHLMAKKCRVANALDAAREPFMGPLMNDTAVERYIGYQGIAVREGCEEIMRGKVLERDTRGHYVSPSIHWVKEPNPKSVYETSELHGPNIAFYRISNIDEAREILGHSKFGLITTVFSTEREIFEKVSSSVRCGSFYWNLPSVLISHRAPMTTLQKSGNATGMGELAMSNCTFSVTSIEGLQNPYNEYPKALRELQP